jgi:hypothetical protein
MSLRRARIGLAALAVGATVLLGGTLLLPQATQATAVPNHGTLIVTAGDLLSAHYHQALCTSDAYLAYSLSTTPGRVVTTGPSIQFASPSDASQILPQKFAHNCGNPTEVDQDIQMFKKVNVDGYNVYAANPWMATFEAKADKLGLRTAFLTLKAGEGKKEFVTPEYQQYAALTNALWLSLKEPVIVTETSIYNWYIPVQTSGELPRVALDPVPDNKPAAKFVIDDKTRTCVTAVGINPLDGRDEILPCTTLTPPVKTPPKSTPPPTHPPVGCVPGKVKNINGKCVTGKDTSPTQYVYAPGKPAAVNDGGTDTAPVVHTATPTPSASPSASPSPEPVKQTDAPTPTTAPTTCPIPPGKTSC